jgi:hypothetical protein
MDRSSLHFSQPVAVCEETVPQNDVAAIFGP